MIDFFTVAVAFAVSIAALIDFFITLKDLRQFCHQTMFMRHLI